MTDLPYLKALLKQDLKDLGVPGDWPYGVADRVRFAELDGLGHVNNAAYLVWFETLRIYYLRDYGISTFDGSSSTSAVVKSVSSEYHSSMLLNESYIATARTVSFRNTSFTMEYGVFAPDLRVTGTAVVVQMSHDLTSKVALSEDTKRLFIDRDGAEPA